MPAGFRKGLSWLGGILVAVAVICLFSLEYSVMSRARESSTMSILHAQNQIVSATRSVLVSAQGAEACDNENEDDGRGGVEKSCCPSNACSGPGVTSTVALLSREPITGAYRAPSPDRQSPLDQTPPEEPPRTA